jgi:hypothetical protein
VRRFFGCPRAYRQTPASCWLARLWRRFSIGGLNDDWPIEEQPESVFDD